ncbi:MAG: tetratricopeptide repeat protein, partial [Candidatus Micrarchaeota archaeon]
MRRRTAILLTTAALAFSPFACKPVVLVESPLVATRAAAPDYFGAPFQSKKLADLVKGIKGSDAEKVKKLFALLNIRTGILKYDKFNFDKLHPPRNVDETLEKGGVCSELAYVVIAALGQLGIKGGTIIIGREENSGDDSHVVAYALVGGQKIFIDLQTLEVGALTVNSKLITDVPSLDEAKSLYYRELGDYYMRRNKDYVRAIDAYLMAISIYDKAAYVHNNLAAAYNRNKNYEKSVFHAKKAVELEPNKTAY